MSVSQTPQPIIDEIMEIDNLVLLRSTVETWAKIASDAVYRFKREDGSFRKDSTAPPGSDEPPHISTSARAYIALLYADRLRDTKGGKKEPDWVKDFSDLVSKAAIGRQGRRFFESRKKRRTRLERIDPYEVNNFDIAHLADFFQVSEYIQRFYGSSITLDRFFLKSETSAKLRFDPEQTDSLEKDSVTDDQYDKAEARLMIESRLRKAIADAARPTQVGFPGEVQFEEGRAESRHYFATLHALRALHVLGVKEIPRLLDVVAGARSFAIEQSYYFQRGAKHRQDPVRLAFAGCIYAIYEEHVDKDLCLAIIESLAAGQQENGSWPATHPVFRQKNVAWHIASHEVALCLSWLYFQPRVPDTARPLIVGMMQKYLLRGVIPTFVRASSKVGETARALLNLDGWQDDHTVAPDKTLGWATAIVCHFLAGFTHVLNDWINRRVIEELGLQLATKRYLIDDTASWPSTRWARDKDRPYVWPDLPPHGWLKDRPDPTNQKSRIERNWTDPELRAAISAGLAEKVLAHIYENPSEQPRSDRCSALMPGSPGTRKTSLLREISEILTWPMVAVPASSIFEDGFDRMEARASYVFGLLNHLRICVIFFDEFEEFFLSRGEDRPRRKKSPNGTPAIHAAPATQSLKSLGGGGMIPKAHGDPLPKGDEVDATSKRQVPELYKSRTIAAFTTSAMLPRLQDLHDQDRCLIFLATNWDNIIDEAVKRVGRFDFTVTVEHPTPKRITQYLGFLAKMNMDYLREKLGTGTSLNVTPLKKVNLLGLENKPLLTILKAVRDALDTHYEDNGEKIKPEYRRDGEAVPPKFAIVEEMLRELRLIEGEGKERIKERATESLHRQLRAQAGGNPPELTSL